MEPAPVSVVIPFYEGGATIQRALDSLSRQTLRPGEVIVVDDGSSTRPFRADQVTCAIPIRTESHPTNRGIPAARNTGIRAAGLPWIGFLDQDDEWAPDKLERQWPVAAAAGDGDIVVFGRLLMETATDSPHLRPPRRAIPAIEVGGRRAVGAFVRHGNVLPLVTLLVPGTVFERHGPLDERLRGGADDTELVLRLVGEGVRFRFAGDPGSGGWSVVHRHTGRNYSDRVPDRVGDQLEFIPRLAAQYPVIEAHRDALLARARFTLGRYHERRGERGGAAEDYRRAIRSDPGWWRPWVAWARLHAPAWLRRATERVRGAVKAARRERPGPRRRG